MAQRRTFSAEFKTKVVFAASDNLTHFRQHKLTCVDTVGEIPTINFWMGSRGISI